MIRVDGTGRAVGSSERFLLKTAFVAPPTVPPTPPAAVLTTLAKNPAEAVDAPGVEVGLVLPVTFAPEAVDEPLLPLATALEA